MLVNALKTHQKRFNNSLKKTSKIKQQTFKTQCLTNINIQHMAQYNNNNYYCG